MSNDNRDTPDDDLWTRRINAIGNWTLRLAQIVVPMLTAGIGLATLYYSRSNNTKIDEARVEVSQKVDNAADHAEKAANTTKQVKTELDASVKERRDQFNEIAQKQDADLKNWHAYNTKEPGDMNKAHEATIRAIGPQ